MNRARDEHDFLAVYVREWSRFFNMTKFLPLAFKVSLYPTLSLFLPILELWGFLQIVDENKPSNGLPCPPKDDEKPDTCREMMLETWMTCIFENVYGRLLKISERLIEIERNSVVPDSKNSKMIVGVRNSFCKSLRSHLYIFSPF